MEQQTVTENEVQQPMLTLIAERADDFLFDTLDADRFSDLEFFTESETGELIVTAEEAGTHVRLAATETGLDFSEAPTVEEADLEPIQITEPQPAPDVSEANVRTRRRGD